MRWLKKGLGALFAPAAHDTTGPWSQMAILPISPMFLARQPILQAKDWQNMLPTGEAGNLIENMAMTGANQAALHWGRMLLTGQGTPSDQASAFVWFQKIANHGQREEQAAALNMLGRCYQHGWGVAIDVFRAFDCYQQAADRGDLWAMFNLADCYRKGMGCRVDVPKAASLYTTAAAKGHVKSLNMLGLCYEEGSGVERDQARAAALFARGAEGGDCWASFNHARLLAQAGKKTQSLEWLERSLEQQSGDYCQIVASLFANHPDEKLQILAMKASAILGKGDAA